MSLLCALAACAILVSLGLLVEGWHHRRQLECIPIRIHVNGTRGKSSVTRLIAAGLRGGGIRTCAKTTGTLARMIFPEGHELPIFRPARANVIEQKRVVRAAVHARAEALVIECMALQPVLQSVCEMQLVRSTHGVITNARADHLDVMGPNRLDVARALAGTTPINGHLFTAETRPDSLQVLRSAALDRSSRMTSISETDCRLVTTQDLAGFSYLEHADNVALALQVCECLGVERQLALRAMWKAEPDPGAMRVHTLCVDGAHWSFLNGFAANDPESTGQLWETASARCKTNVRKVLIMNCRVDRPDRSLEMARAIPSWPTVDQIIVTGTGTDVFLRQLLDSPFPKHHIDCLGEASAEEVVQTIAQRQWEANPSEPGDLMLMGMGNVAGVGFLVDHFFQKHSVWTSREDRRTAPSLSASTATPEMDLLEVS